jgi:hypothetical protein
MTKIGTGMGEQMLSREYYHLGTQLPTDRFLTFYAGPGFQTNNILIILSVQVFILTSERRHPLVLFFADRYHLQWSSWGH